MSLQTLRELLTDFDLVGFGLFAPSAVLFLLALQMGGNMYPWDSPTIWGLFDGAFLGAFFFILWEMYRGERALMPTPIIRQKVVVAGMIHHACIQSTITISIYYLPYYFQSVLNKSPVTGGIDLLPSIVSQLTFAILAGVYSKCLSTQVCHLRTKWWLLIDWPHIVKKVGIYLPFALVGNAMNSIGTGLLSTLSPSTATAKWAGYQIIAGAGRGSAFQLVRNARTQGPHTPPTRTHGDATNS